MEALQNVHVINSSLYTIAHWPVQWSSTVSFRKLQHQYNKVLGFKYSTDIEMYTIMRQTVWYGYIEIYTTPHSYTIQYTFQTSITIVTKCRIVHTITHCVTLYHSITLSPITLLPPLRKTWFRCWTPVRLFLKNQAGTILLEDYQRQWNFGCVHRFKMWIHVSIPDLSSEIFTW